MAEGDRHPIKGRNPLTMVVVVAAATIIGLFYGPAYLGGLFLAGLVLAAAVGRLKPFLLVTVSALLPAAVVMFALQFFFTQGTDVIFRAWLFTGTTEGLANGIKFATRFLVIGVGVLTLVQLVDLRRFARDLEQRGVSPRTTYVLQSTFLIIPEMQKRGAAILDAQRARGIETDAGVGTRVRALLPAVAPLILSSLTGVEERAMSLEARGMTLSGPKTSLEHIADNGFDRTLRWVVGIGLVVFLGWRVWSWLS